MGPSELAGSVSQGLWDFLTFRSFVAPHLLLIFYYLGALGVPALVWRISATARAKLRDAQLPEVELEADGVGRVMLSRRRLGLYMFAGFLGGELAWRFLFEFLIAYFQMRDYMFHLQSTMS